MPDQPLEAPVAVHLELAVPDLAGRQRRQAPERLVHHRQKPDVRVRVDRLELPAAVAHASVLHRAGLRLLPEQAADLRRREPAHLADVRPHAALIGAAEQVVVELRRRLPHERA